MNKTERKQFLEASEKEFLDAWSKASKELEAAKVRCKEFAAIQRERDAKAKIEAMDPQERAHLAQFVSVHGIDASSPVNGDES